MSEIPQRIIDKVNKEHSDFRKIFLIISIPFLTVIAIVFLVSQNTILFGVMLFGYILGMIPIMGFLGGDSR